MGAAIAEAKAKADAEVQQATNWCASEIAKVDADLAIAQQETQKRVVDAQTRRAAMIAESEGQVAAQVAQVTAEIERQKARALQVKRRLDADVVQVAEASRRAMEEEARGQAAMLVERGKAEAEALRHVFEAFALAGEGARDVLALQQVIPLLTQVSGAGRKLVVKKVSVLPPAYGNGGDFARSAIAATEQIKAAMGVDLPAIARRLEHAEGMRPAPAAKARTLDAPEKGKETGTA
jgi:flotillin